MTITAPKLINVTGEQAGSTTGAAWAASRFFNLDGMARVRATCERDASGGAESFAAVLARMIDQESSAPELLAELHRVKAWMEDCLMDRQAPGLPSRARYDAVSAVIARAEAQRGC